MRTRIGFRIMYLVVCTAMLAPAVIAASDEEQDFLDLASSLSGKTEACPIRVELPVDDLFQETEATFRSGRTAVVRCDGAYITSLSLERHPARGRRKPRVRAVAYVVLPKGRDQLVKVRYWLLKGDNQLASGTDRLKADEGEINWSEGVDLWYDPKAFVDSEGGPILRIEAVFSDR